MNNLHEATRAYTHYMLEEQKRLQISSSVSTISEDIAEFGKLPEICPNIAEFEKLSEICPDIAEFEKLPEICPDIAEFGMFPEICLDDKLYDYAHIFMNNMVDREMLLSLPNNADTTWQSEDIMNNLHEATRAYTHYMLEEQKRLQISSSVSTICEDIAEFGKLPEICLEDKLYDYAHIFMNNMLDREMLMSLPDNADATWQSKDIINNLPEATRAYTHYILEEQKRLQISSSVSTISEDIAGFGKLPEICQDIAEFEKLPEICQDIAELGKIPEICQDIAEFGKLPEICLDDKFYDYANIFMNNMVDREMLMSLPDNADSTGNVSAETFWFVGDCMTSCVITMREALEELSKHSEIRDNVDLFYFATIFLRDKDMREIFMSIPEDLKVRWLTKCFQDGFYKEKSMRHYLF
ncbi:hypothetical protein KSP39_PZI011109 [Platanthera zijinensis]|uniref:Uncharacterized protein n=1 Tax=Platanthera zijinensis TaxID=2320716 RepID=A0AAP0BGD2_9ASPA